MESKNFHSSARGAGLVLACALGVVAQCGVAQTASADSTVLNPYSPAYGHSYRHGVVPTSETHQDMKLWRAQNAPAAALAAAPAAAPTGTQTVSYGGGLSGAGVISGTPRVYLVVYGNQWGNLGFDAQGNLTFSGDSVGAVPYLQRLMKGLGTGGELWSGVMTQYCDGAVPLNSTTCPSTAPKIGYPGGATLAGVWYDNSVAAPAQASQAQLAQEAANAAAHFGNTTPGINRYTQYVIMSPSGTHPDGFNTGKPNGFCAWHDYTSGSSGNIAYTNLPYVYDMRGSCGANWVNAGAAGYLDGFSIVEGHEYAETLTDQFPNTGWINHTGSSFNGEEAADECVWLTSGQGALANVSMATGNFAMQSVWSNDTNRCDISHPVVVTQAGAASLSSSPSSVSISQSGAIIVTRGLTITNGGPGTMASITTNVTQLSGTVGDLTISRDTCTGSSLNPGETCVVQIEFESGCLFNGNSTSKWNVTVNGAVANTLTVPVTGTTTKGICQ